MAMKKKFIKIVLPLIGTETSVLGTLDSLENKTVKMDLSRQSRGKGLEIVFILQNKEGKLVGIPKKIFLMQAYIKRIMRKKRLSQR